MSGEETDSTAGTCGTSTAVSAAQRLPPGACQPIREATRGRTYVVVPGDDERSFGYYTLASGEIKSESFPNAKKLPRHAVPVVLLARLAVSRAPMAKACADISFAMP